MPERPGGTVTPSLPATGPGRCKGQHVCCTKRYMSEVRPARLALSEGRRGEFNRGRHGGLPELTRA
eukprot:13106967-Alexandrium_andersonii.AAC.1